MMKLFHKSAFSDQQGSILIALLIFMIVGTTITTAAIMMMIDNTAISSNALIADQSLMIAESGAENAILRLLRDPGYTGEVLSVGDGQAVITVSGSEAIVVTSTGEIGVAQRIVEVQLERENGVLTVDAWREIE